MLYFLNISFAPNYFSTGKILILHFYVTQTLYLTIRSRLIKSLHETCSHFYVPIWKGSKLKLIPKLRKTPNTIDVRLVKFNIFGENILKLNLRGKHILRGSVCEKKCSWKLSVVAFCLSLLKIFENNFDFCKLSIKIPVSNFKFTKNLRNFFHFF